MDVTSTWLSVHLTRSSQGSTGWKPCSHQPEVGGPDDRFVGPPVRVEARRRQQVAREMLPDQLVVRDVAVEGADEVVAVPPGERDVGVALAAVRLAVAEQVHPVARPALAEVWRVEVAVHQVGVRRWRPVAGEPRDLGRGRRQPPQIERQAADERRAVGVRGRGESRLLEPRQDEPVGRRRRPGLVIHGGRVRGLHRLPRPVRAPPLRQIEQALTDPADPRRRRRPQRATARPSRPTA